MASPLRRRKEEEKQEIVPRRVETPLPPAEAERRRQGIPQQGISDYIRMLTSPSAQERRIAAGRLGMIGDQQAVQPLIERLDDRDARVREAAAFALSAIGDHRASEAIAARLAIERDHGTRSALLWAIGSCGPESGGVPAFTRMLVRELQRGREESRIPAAHGLGAWGDRSAVPALIESLGYGGGASSRTDPDQRRATPPGAYGVRNEAVEALVRLAQRDLSVVGALMDALRSPDENIRMNAAKALGRIGDVRAVPDLIGMAGSDSDLYARMAAAEALGRIGDTRAVPAIIVFLGGPLMGEVGDRARGAAAEALGRLHDARAIGPLIGALDDPSEIVRMGAIRALGSLGDRSAIGPLIRILEGDRFEALRAAAALSLGSLGGAEAGDALRRALSGGSQPVRAASERALASMR